MKRFETFGEYMFDLLFAPLKRGKRSKNQFFIFFRVVGRIFDGMKDDVFRVRAEANVATASPPMLTVHGRDRGMQRLLGEDDEAYRTRLSMKGIIAEEAGTKKGILRALTALGYDKSYIEPLAYQDPERWAEFIVYLNGSRRSGVNDLNVIDAEVRKVKEGSSKPSYGSEVSGGILIASRLQAGLSCYPRCGEIVCGVFPDMASIGNLFSSHIAAQGDEASGDVIFPRVGTLVASKAFYQFADCVTYEGFASDVRLATGYGSGSRDYPLCSNKTKMKGERQK